MLFNLNFFFQKKIFFMSFYFFNIFYPDERVSNFSARWWNFCCDYAIFIYTGISFFSKFFKLLLLMAHYLSCIFSSFCPDKGKEFFIFLFFIGCSYIFSWDFLSLYFSWSKKSEISHHSCLSKNVIDWDDFLVL